MAWRTRAPRTRTRESSERESRSEQSCSSTHAESVARTAAPGADRRANIHTGRGGKHSLPSAAGLQHRAFGDSCSNGVRWIGAASSAHGEPNGREARTWARAQGAPLRSIHRPHKEVIPGDRFDPNRWDRRCALAAGIFRDSSMLART